MPTATAAVLSANRPARLLNVLRPEPGHRHLPGPSVPRQPGATEPIATGWVTAGSSALRCTPRRSRGGPR
jgi:hypothetical protein